MFRCIFFTAKADATTTGPIFCLCIGIPEEVGLRTYMDDDIMATTSLKGRSTRRHFKKSEKLRKIRKTS